MLGTGDEGSSLLLLLLQPRRGDAFASHALGVSALRQRKPAAELTVTAPRSVRLSLCALREAVPFSLCSTPSPSSPGIAQRAGAPLTPASRSPHSHLPRAHPPGSPWQRTSPCGADHQCPLERMRGPRALKSSVAPGTPLSCPSGCGSPSVKWLLIGCL